MQNDPNRTYMDEESWLDCIGELIQKSNGISSEILQNDDPVFLQTPTFPLSYHTLKQTMSVETQILDGHNFPQTSNKRQLISDPAQSDSQQRFDKQEEEGKSCDQSSKQQSKQSQKNSKYGKQSQYSKNYREKKKQKLRILQEQKNYLKQKINQLQFRLRQKQLQVNRLKHPPEEKELSVEQLNEEFIKKTTLLLSKTAIDPETYGKTIYTPEDKFYAEFIKSYDEHGFGGMCKKNTLNYYFNELLESIIKDSQKYLFLVCNNAKNPQLISGLQTYQQIDSTFQEIMQLDEDKTQRIKHFTVNLHAFMIELKQICSDFCKDFNKIIAFLDKVHNFMKSSYPQNMDFARKRIQLQNWFEQNKHTKLIRRLRSEWLEFIKKCAESRHTQKCISKGRKKKHNPEEHKFP